MQDFDKSVDLVKGLWDHTYALLVEGFEVSKYDPTMAKKVTYDASKTLQNFQAKYRDLLMQADPHYKLGKIMKKIAAGEAVSNAEIGYGLKIIEPLVEKSRKDVAEAGASFKKYL